MLLLVLLIMSVMMMSMRRARTLCETDNARHRHNIVIHPSTIEPAVLRRRASTLVGGVVIVGELCGEFDADCDDVAACQGVASVVCQYVCE